MSRFLFFFFFFLLFYFLSFAEPDLEQLNYSLNTNTDIVLATVFVQL